MYQVEIFVLPTGKAPFIDWYTSFRDRATQVRIRNRITRIELGNLGDHKYLEGGIGELRLHFGSGYRIYFGRAERMIILLLCGGDKSTQTKDIRKAKKYWQNYLETQHDK